MIQQNVGMLSNAVPKLGFNSPESLRALVLVRESSGKQSKTASRFAVIRVAEPVAVQDFRRE
jgi:hypothetical protein